MRCRRRGRASNRLRQRLLGREGGGALRGGLRGWEGVAWCGWGADRFEEVWTGDASGLDER